jgi:tRNA (cytidine/uridine-2'-O-)-methyltransferase
LHRDWAACRTAIDPRDARRWYALTTKAARSMYDCALSADDILVFGCETSGLPTDILDRFAPDARLRIPMRPGVRSLNLSNAVAIAVYEAWRQAGFGGAGS